MESVDRLGRPEGVSDNSIRAWVTAWTSGTLFAIGLAVAGMTKPQKVIGFLDVSGAWDPSLALVMAGALAVYTPLYRILLHRRKPWFEDSYCLPIHRGVDAKLLVGAIVFGVGWGLSGYCPGPAIVSAAGGASSSLIFFASMIAGMGLYWFFQRKKKSVPPCDD